MVQHLLQSYLSPSNATNCERMQMEQRSDQTHCFRCMHAKSEIHNHTHTCARTHTCTHTHIHTHTHKHKHTCIVPLILQCFNNSFMYIHAHTHTHTHTA